jgi:hypothetical protein
MHVQSGLLVHMSLCVEKLRRNCVVAQTVTEQISKETGHLPGVTIAVMGCIVNGPGEMADADFGYVGGAPGEHACVFVSASVSMPMSVSVSMYDRVFCMFLFCVCCCCCSLFEPMNDTMMLTQALVDGTC